MADWTLAKLGFRAGVWEGRLTAAAKSASEPEIEVQAEGVPVPGAELRPDGKGAWLLAVPVPAEALGDGIRTFLVADKSTGTALASFSIAAGEPADDDLRAEVALLRAELDMLKKAFRRLAAREG
jgi:hypothetical protein